MPHVWSDSDDERHLWSDSDDERHLLSDSSSDSDEASGRSPAALFIDFLVELLLSRSITAKAFCVLMHYAGRCGIAGCSQLGRRPDLPTGHYQRHLSKHLAAFRDAAPEYEISIPISNKYNVGRDVVWMPVLVAQEELEAELKEYHSWAEDLQSAIDDGSLPPGYDSHPVVLNSASPPVPIALFVDAVPYSNVDSLIGFWIVNLLTWRRHLIIAIRKALLCKCGCKGWCTFWAIFYYLHWDFYVMSTGHLAQARHDGHAWRETDSCRKIVAGTAAIATYALIWIKGDWAEYAHTLGFPAWNSALRCCLFCNCTLEDMYKCLTAGPARCLHRLNDDDDYFTGCSRCEVDITIPDHTHHSSICRLLWYDKRDQGSRGLAIKDDYPQCGLIAGDRLDPTPSLPNIDDVFRLRDFPLCLKFWRPSCEYITRHRNPLFDASLGITPQRSLTACVLHVLFLGLMLRLCRIILWMIILSGVLAQSSSVDELVNISAIALQNMMLNWYQCRHDKNPSEGLTRLHLRESKLGSRSDQKLKAKGAETWGLLLFLLDLLDQVQERIPDRHRAKRLLRAGRALETLYVSWRDAPMRPSATDQAKAWHAYNIFIHATESESECELPKRHILVHVLERMADLGNPRFYANWMDETLNKHLKNACRLVSQVNFERSLYCRMRELLKRFHRRSAEKHMS
jgi:hypothetical protein